MKWTDLCATTEKAQWGQGIKRLCIISFQQFWIQDSMETQYKNHFQWCKSYKYEQFCQVIHSDFLPNFKHSPLQKSILFSLKSTHCDSRKPFNLKSEDEQFGEHFRKKLLFYIMMHLVGCRQGLLYNLRVPVQNENAVFLIQKVLRTSR